MLEFIKIAYILTVPLWLLFAIAGSPSWKKNGINLLALTNLLLIGNSVFVCRQLIGMYYFARSLDIAYKPIGDRDHWFAIQLTCMVLLPLLSLLGYFRKNIWYSLLVLVLLYRFYPVGTWNSYDISYKIVTWLCLMCAGYALLWLLNKLPYQSPVR
jgi:hypothetical protein